MKKFLKLAVILILCGTTPIHAKAPRIIVFDVNETLLDIGALDPQFVRIFGDAKVAQEWFSNVVLYSQVTTITGPYVDFGSVARASLKMTAAAHGRPLTQADEDEVIKGLVSLPAHPDVREGLEKTAGGGVPPGNPYQFGSGSGRETTQERGDQ